MDDHNPDLEVVDEFAQTRGADDLFDDEIIPVSAEEQTQTVTVEEATDDAPEKRESDTQTRQETSPSRSRGSERGRGRGRGRGARGGRASHDRGSTRAETHAKNKPAEKAGDGPTKETDAVSEGTQDDKATDGKEKAESEGSTGKSSDAAPRVQAVRGDRSGTGGIRKPKLSEDELSARIAAAKLHAAKIAAAHARAEADQASFQEREKVAAEKRRQEFQNRRAMDNERERNRLRKLGAQTGREWDSVKREEDYNPRGGGSQYRRGMHGGVSGYTRQSHENGSDSGDSHRGSRGRGGRGGRGRGQRGGRGDYFASNNHDHAAMTTNATAPSAPVINNENEFPSLPGGSPKEQGPGPTVVTDSTAPGDAPIKGDKSPAALSPLTPSAGGSWAEQVESSGAAKA
ncbi:conserved hypothetical protein [Paecilomyces variotii No. 5]|uniref:Uncharacterized protein n=1 Tax=Byssochlamys spectabilis (strain No. 5 / NBRC 109023) TaxID=1356009 RepID=V5I363_BYSSN|nr:conserved hypothetical protein [Paecilomyces variotii No. 5]